MEIKVVGSGCKNCKNLLQATQQAVQELNLDARILYVTEVAEIAATGIMRTPGLLINGRIKAMGRVPGVKEIRQMIEDELVAGG